MAIEKTVLPAWLTACLVTAACAPPNRVAKELSDTDTANTTAAPKDGGAEASTDPYPDCRVGGGDQTCSAVTVCERDCNSDTACREECKSRLCASHEGIFCERDGCIEATCGTYCDDLGAADCIVCISLGCASEWAACAAAASCDDDVPQVK